MHLRALIKLNARRALRKSWSKAMAIAMLVTGVSLLFMLFEALLMTVFELPVMIDSLNTPTVFLDDVPNISSAALFVMSAIGLLCFMVTSPLSLGINGWFFKLGRGESDDVSSVFEFFQTLPQMLKAAWLYFNLWVRSTLCVLLFLAPSISVVTFATLFSQQALSESEKLIASGAATAGVLLGMACLVLAAIRLQRFFCAGYYIIANPSMSVRKAIKSSCRATAGYKGELFKVQLSLLGWRFFGGLIVTRLYTVPFISTVEGLYASFLMQADLTRETELERLKTEAVTEENQG